MRRPSIRLSTLRSTKRSRTHARVVTASVAMAAVASLASAPVAGARIAPDKTVGESRTSTQASVGTGRGGAIRAQATTPLSCNPAEGFSRTDLGALFKVLDSDPSGGANTMTQSATAVGSGWMPGTFAWIASGGDGVVYALKWNGELRWYRWMGTGWASGGGKVVGTGFTPGTSIVNIGIGANGWLYVVRANRQLVLFKHLGRLNGSATWANGTGWTIGSGWTGNELITPTGDGTIYRQYQGSLYWYRHTDPAAGAVTWNARTTVGTGWNFYDVLSAGGGLLYATSGGDGKVYTYQHQDPTGGTNVWAMAHGVLKMTVKSNSYGITIDPVACVRR